MSVEGSEESRVRPRADGHPLPGENQVIWTIWLTYGAFYFCRTNISVALPGIEAELGFTKLEMAVVLSALKVAYAIGQLVNGQLAERLPARVMLAIGMFGSAGLNIVFGLGSALYFFLFVWACNGFCQSLGWTPCMRVVANWIPVQRRGIGIGIIGTGYQVTLGLTFLVAGLAVTQLGYGWRGAFFVPSLLLVAAAIFMLVFLQESPDDRPATTSAKAPARETIERNGLLENLLLTLSNTPIWLLGISLGLLNACRYGFLDWGVTHLTEVQSGAEDNVLKAAVKYAVLPIGAVVGSFGAGWATDRFFGGRRAPVIAGMLACLGGLTFAYDAVARTSFVGTLFLLGLIGIFIYGPQVLLVGTAPADLAKRGTAAAAAGFVNFMGYMGAFAGDLVTGYLVHYYDWRIGIFFWAGCALTAAITVAILWNATAE